MADVTDERMRELEIIVKLIDMDTILARRREGRQGEANRKIRTRR